MPNKLPVQTAEDLAKFQINAIKARTLYADAKRQLKRGERSFVSVLDDDKLKRMRVHSVIASLPGFGKCSADKVMDEVGISKTRRLAGLGVRQRAALIEKLG